MQDSFSLGFPPQLLRDLSQLAQQTSHPNCLIGDVIFSKFFLCHISFVNFVSHFKECSLIHEFW